MIWEESQHRLRSLIISASQIGSLPRCWRISAPRPKVYDITSQILVYFCARSTSATAQINSQIQEPRSGIRSEWSDWRLERLATTHLGTYIKHSTIYIIRTGHSWEPYIVSNHENDPLSNSFNFSPVQPNQASRDPTATSIYETWQQCSTTRKHDK